VKVPENRPRFVEAGPLRYVFLEDVIAAHMHMLFPGMEIIDVDTMRIIRSAKLARPAKRRTIFLR
jgi:polyphosphate kinase